VSSPPDGPHDLLCDMRWSPGTTLELFRGFMDLPELGFLILDREHRVEFANAWAGRITGFDPARMLGMDFLTLFDPSERPSILRALSHEEGDSLEATLSTSGGARRVVDLSWRAHKGSGDEARFLVAFRDVSRHRSAQRAAMVAQEEARNVAEMADVGIFLLDKDFRIDFANQTGAEIIGLTPSELQGRNFSAFMNEDTRLRLKGLATGLGPGEHRRLNMEVPIQLPRGEERLADITLAAVGGPEGEVKIYAYLRNLTESIQLRKANEFLQNVIRSSVDGIIAADMKGNIIIFNEGGGAPARIPLS
jgi:PAS domain S-box-containing protein